MSDYARDIIDSVYSVIIWGITPRIDGLNDEESLTACCDFLARLAGEKVVELLECNAINIHESIIISKEIGKFIAERMF